MSSSNQTKRIEKAIDAVDWTALSGLADREIMQRWSDDPDASWPEPDELAEFKLIAPCASTKPPQAAE